jgi:hypothetical protein
MYLRHALKVKFPVQVVDLGQECDQYKRQKVTLAHRRLILDGFMQGWVGCLSCGFSVTLDTTGMMSRTGSTIDKLK